MQAIEVSVDRTSGHVKITAGKPGDSDTVYLSIQEVDNLIDALRAEIAALREARDALATPRAGDDNLAQLAVDYNAQLADEYPAPSRATDAAPERAATVRLTRAQREALEAMTRHDVLQGARKRVADYEVAGVTARSLMKLGYAKMTNPFDYAGFRYAITPAGRAALRDASEEA